MKALLDGDILVYRVGFGANDETEGIARSRMDESIEKILEAVRADSYEVFLTSSDKSNYRHAIFPDYKANRKAPKPTHYDLLRDYLVSEHKAEMVHGQEADDAMAIAQVLAGKDTIICTIDKDLDQIPGWHYNFVKGLKYKVTEFEGLLKLYTQLLMGDAVDNIKGIPGIGPKKAEKLLEGCISEQDMYNAVEAAYKAAFPENYMEMLRTYGLLLKIRTFEGENWKPLPERALSAEHPTTNTESVNPALQSVTV